MPTAKPPIEITQISDEVRARLALALGALPRGLLLAAAPTPSDIGVRGQTAMWPVGGGWGVAVCVQSTPSVVWQIATSRKDMLPGRTLSANSSITAADYGTVVELAGYRLDPGTGAAALVGGELAVQGPGTARTSDHGDVVLRADDSAMIHCLADGDTRVLSASVTDVPRLNVSSDTPPVGPIEGDMWYDRSTSILSIFMDGYWVEQIAASSGHRFTISDGVAPTEPNEGDMWYDRNTAALSIYTDGYWVEQTPSSTGLDDIYTDAGAVHNLRDDKRNAYGRMSHTAATAHTLTVKLQGASPYNYPSRYSTMVRNASSGAMTIAGDVGVTLSYATGRNVLAQGETVTLLRVAENSWDVIS